MSKYRGEERQVLGGVTRREMLKGAGALGAAAMGGSVFQMGNREAGAAPTGFPEAKFVQTNGIRMAVYEQGEGFPVVFSHGFPELAYSWRYQLPALAKAGFRAIAPDQRGYGLTEAPKDVSAYSIQNLCGDLAGLLDALEIEKAVFCGHDWGGAVVWMMPLLHPDRVAGVIGVNTPFLPRSPISPIKLMTQMRGENNYIVFFQKPGVADGILAADVEKTFKIFLRKGGITAEEFAKLPADAPERNFELMAMIEAPIDESAGEPLIGPEELAFYVETFERTGFTGGINWYRNIERNWETTGDLIYKVERPCLMVTAEDDVVLPPSMAAGIETWVPDIETHMVKACGHWTQQEKPDELNATMIAWLKKRMADLKA